MKLLRVARGWSLKDMAGLDYETLFDQDMLGDDLEGEGADAHELDQPVVRESISAVVATVVTADTDAGARAARAEADRINRVTEAGFDFDEVEIFFTRIEIADHADVGLAAQGLQLGLVNNTVTMEGVQIGLINIIQKGGMLPGLTPPMSAWWPRLAT